MNENKRILLLALGIMATVASDPPVASYFERPQSVCSIVADLAVGAFDSLVRSTLPLPTTEPEHELSNEVLVAGVDRAAPVKPSFARTASREANAVAAAVARTVDAPLITTSAVPVVVRSACSGSEGAPVEVLRVEAVIEVHGSAIGHS